MSMNGPKRALAHYEILADQVEAFWAHVNKTSRCWVWLGVPNASGYGTFAVGRSWTDKRGKRRRGRTRLAHRVGYQIQGGRLIAGYDLDHVRKLGCRSRLCVRIDHLEPVPPLENCTRDDIWAWNRRKTHCPSGHRYAGANLHRYGGRRVCRTCRVAAGQRYRARLRGEDVALRPAGCAPKR